MKIKTLACLLSIALGSADSVLAKVDLPQAPQTPEVSRRVKLAEQYLGLLRYEDRQADVQHRGLRSQLAEYGMCNSGTCEADLDRTIQAATARAAHQFAEKYAELLADKLTDAQLNAAIRFAKSPEGQAIVKSESQANDQLAQMSREAAEQSQQEIMSHFCPSHKDACAAFYERYAKAGRNFGK